MDREAWHAAIHGVAKSWTQRLNWTELKICPHCQNIHRKFRSVISFSEFVQTLWRTVWRLLKNRTAIWSSSPTPGHVFRKDENCHLKRHMHPSVHSSKTWKQPTCPSTEGWKKIQKTRTHSRMLLNHKNTVQEIMTFAATWMDILNNSCGEKHYLHVEVKNSKIGLIHTTKTDSQT